MKQILDFSGLVLMSLALAGCGGTAKQSIGKTGRLDTMPVIAERLQYGSDSIVVADLSSLDAPVTLRLSDLVETLEVIRLENSDEALVGGGGIWVSDNRLLINSGDVVKQFDRQGKYIGTVGAKGQGPGEYEIAPYDIAVDEEAGRIYLLEFSTDKLLIYDLDGKYVGNVPLTFRTRKGIVEVDTKGNRITVGALQFSGDEPAFVAWTQDLEGNLLGGVERKDLTVVPDYSNEVIKGYSPDGEFTYSLFRYEPSPDTLYTYSDGMLTPEFTARFNDDVPMHMYMSYPGFYVIDTAGKPVEVGEGMYHLPSLPPIVIDKKTLRGGRTQLMLDIVGPVTAPNSWFFSKSPGYFAKCVDPGDLADMIDGADTDADMVTAEDIRRMEEFKASIGQDDNSYVIIGRWKK